MTVNGTALVGNGAPPVEVARNHAFNMVPVGASLVLSTRAAKPAPERLVDVRHGPCVFAAEHTGSSPYTGLAVLHRWPGHQRGHPIHSPYQRSPLVVIAPAPTHRWGW
jgi:hypothetical protein